MQATSIKMRALVAIGMIILILLMFTTGVILWLASRGFSQNATLWNIAFAIHPIGGWGIFLLSIVHLALNKKLFQSDIKTLWKKPR
ncbi:MAG: hypothetical protein HPY68_06495 [Candidatus Atribacteria bacterium]|nr:hypothetical protein [Candidatus Atribacteria bacterium]